MKTSEYITNVAIKMVKKNGLINLSRSDLCRHVNISTGSFIHIMNCTFSEFLTKLKDQDIESTTHHKVVKTRTNPRLRKAHILKAAMILAEINGVHNIQRKHIADYAGVSVALVTKYFGTIKKLRRSIVRAAIKQESLHIIAYAVVCHDPAVAKISIELRTRALQCLK